MFDILVNCLAFGIFFLPDEYYRNILFVFGILFLWCLSLIARPKRVFSSISLGFLLTLSLFGVFLHAYTISIDSIVFRYLNVYLMFEGFVYLLAGIMFIKLFFENCEYPRIYYFTIPILTGLWLFHYGPRVTLWLALALGTTVHLFIKRRLMLAFGLLLASSCFAFLNFKFILSKWVCRPLVWMDMLRAIKEHPLIGFGFDKSLFPSSMIFLGHDGFGWIFRHNDYLAVWMDLGIFALLSIMLFLLRVYSASFRRPFSIFFIAFSLCSFFQSTIYNSYHAIIILITIGVCLVLGEGNNGRKLEKRIAW